MPGATSTVTVDGVEPSILVKLLNISDNPASVKIFTADDGTERWLHKENEEPVLVTPNDLAVLGGVGVEIVHPEQDGETDTNKSDNKSSDNESTVQQQKPAEGVVKVSPVITPGQSSPQA